MAAPSRMMLKSSSAALNLFTKSKSILNRLPPRASALVLTSPESGSSRLIDQLAGSRLNSGETRLRFLNDQLLPVWFTGSGSGSADEEMLMARGPRKVVESEDDGSETDEDDDSVDIEDFDADDSDEELDDGEFEEDEPWKKVRTRSRRDH